MCVSLGLQFECDRSESSLILKINMGDAVKMYSLEEIKGHNSVESAWCIYKNEVYDFTTFINEHPGGGDNLLEAAGGDLTAMFDDQGHSDNALKIMKKFKIGELRMEDHTQGGSSTNSGKSKECCIIV
jgi:cytochrome b involved in lipid metabolism